MTPSRRESSLQSSANTPASSSSSVMAKPVAPKTQHSALPSSLQVSLVTPPTCPQNNSPRTGSLAWKNVSRRQRITRQPRQPHQLLRRQPPRRHQPSRWQPPRRHQPSRKRKKSNLVSTKGNSTVGVITAVILTNKT